MQKLIANIYLKKPAIDILLENFERFLYIAIDIELKNAFFILFLLCGYINSLYNIIVHLNIKNNDYFFYVIT